MGTRRRAEVGIRQVLPVDSHQVLPLDSHQVLPGDSRQVPVDSRQVPVDSRQMLKGIHCLAQVGNLRQVREGSPALPGSLLLLRLRVAAPVGTPALLEPVGSQKGRADSRRR